MKILKAIGGILCTAACFYSLGCGTTQVETIAAPSISAVLPQTIAAGSSAVTMKVVGTNFNANAVILWNGNKLATSVVDANTLSGSIQGGSLAVPGTAQVQVQNIQTGQASQSVPISIISSNTTVALPLAISVPAIPAGVVAKAWSVALSATGGTPAYTWALGSGALPAGLSLDASTGTISGTPTASGTFSVSVTVTDSSSPVQTQSASLSITIAPAPAVPAQLAVATTALVSGTDGAAYSQSLQATGGTPAYTWSITSGSLPAGLTLVGSSGVISGVPTTSGTVAFTATVKDSSSPAQTKSVSLSITVASSQLAITSATVASGIEGAAYSQTLHASGGTPAYRWSVTSGSLPAGLTLAAGTGVLSGTPTTTGTFLFTVTVSDASSPVQSKSVALSVTIAGNQLNITSTSLASAAEGKAYAQTLAATGGTPAYSWSIANGSLPTGLTLASGSGVISGIPTVSGTFSFTAKVTDSGSPVQTKSVGLSITVASNAMTITTVSLPSTTTGAAYSQGLAVSGGTPAYSWSILSGSLPTGLTLTGSGVISGTPTGSGTSTFTVSVSDSESPVQTRSAVLSITVASTTLSILSSSLAAAVNGAAYSTTLHASGGTPAYSWSIVSGSLPTGLSLAAGTGVISGTPTANGVSTFTVSVTDSGSPVQTRTLTLTLTVAGPVLTITSSTLAAATVGTSYSQTLAASGGSPAYTWSITSGNLPAGLSLTSTGQISGTPTASGTYRITVNVTDSSSPVQSQSAVTSIIVAAQSIVGPGTTWFVRPDGGTRFSANVPTGQCNGTSDAAYPGAGVDQDCAFNDIRYLWSDNSGAQNAWVMAGGDTAVIRGCTGLPSQLNASNPDCRLGYDNASNGNAPNFWCGYGVGNEVCFNPPIPAGSAAQPTRILGGCAYGTYSCTPINNNYPYGPTNETQLFGGFGLTWTFNLESTRNVVIEGIELTTHNGVCTIGMGTPAYPRACSSSIPYDDYAQNGFLFNTGSANITLQDVYIHGFNASGLHGPIGGQITLTRVFSGFNAFAGWNFDDGSGTQDATGSGITASYVTMIFNGCYEQYPITATYPAQVCYDTNSAGFGDSWSGQGVGTESVLTSFICDHCVDNYNTKDGFIGPHIAIPNLTITNSVAIGNMGANWKWGGEDGVINTTTFENNLTVSNCSRMSQPMAGVPSTYNRYLTGFCRAGGNGIASIMPIGSIWNMRNNTFITAQQIAWYVACAYPDLVCPATINSTNNVFLGYTDPNNPYGGTNVPTLYYLDAGIILNASHNDEFGMRLGSCPSTANGMICADPQLLNEPAQAWPGAESDLDVFNPFVAGNSFQPTSTSPLVGAGLQIPGLTTDYYGVTRPTPPSIGGVEQSPTP